MIIGIPREVLAGERRVALVPTAVKTLVDAGLEVLVEAGAGAESGHLDGEYEDAGARLAQGAAAVLGGADVILKVQPPQPLGSGDGSRAGLGEASHEVDLITEGAALISLLKPLDEPALAERLAKRRVTAFAMELMPRITRAQSMDALSSQSSLAGYEAVLMAASTLPRIFPMMVTAAGTMQPSKVLVIGAGVAGLQAIATRQAARRGGLGLRHASGREGAGAEPGRALRRARSRHRRRRGRRRLREGPERGVLPAPARAAGRARRPADVVITTALVPGQRAPLLIEEAAVQGMRPGSVIVDLAAEKGGNCACTRADEVVTSTASRSWARPTCPRVPANASQMYARNLVTFLQHLSWKAS